MPRARKVAIPQAVACLEPCLSACAKTPIETAADRTRTTRNWPKLSSYKNRRPRYVTAPRNSSIVRAVIVWNLALPRAPRATDTFAIVAVSGASTTLTKS